MADRARDWVAASIGLLLLLYAIARAAVLPIFFDEAFTYLAYIRAPLGALLNPFASDRPLTVNNHVLNTLLAKACVTLLGTSEFVLRIPNLAALASYLVFVWMLLRRYSGFLPPLAGFLLLCTNPFLLELFSAARGYGLSLGLLAPALYLLARSFESDAPSREREILAFLLLAAAALASYPMLNVYGAALMVWIVAGAVRTAREDGPPHLGRAMWASLRKSAPVLLISVALTAAAGPMLFELRRTGGFYWGGTSGFWKDTLSSVVVASLYNASYAAALRPFLLGFVAAAAGTVALLISLPSLRRTDPSRMRVLAGIVGMTALSAVAVILEHLLFEVRLPVDRMAVFFVPLFFLSLWLALEMALRVARPVWRRLTRIAVICLSLACLAHLGAAGGLWTSYLWQYDLDTPAMLADLTRLRERQTVPGRRIRLGVAPFFTAGVDYYRIVQNLSWLAPLNQLGPWGDYDFIYILPSEAPEAGSRGYEILRTYPHTGNLLCRPPRPFGASPARRTKEQIGRRRGSGLIALPLSLKSRQEKEKLRNES